MEKQSTSCPCACHANVLHKPYSHDRVCCEAMNGMVEEQWDQKEWLENVMYVVDGLTKTQWEALLVLIEQKCRYRSTAAQVELLETILREDVTEDSDFEFVNCSRLVARLEELGAVSEEKTAPEGK